MPEPVSPPSRPLPSLVALSCLLPRHSRCTMSASVVGIPGRPCRSILFRPASSGTLGSQCGFSLRGPCVLPWIWCPKYTCWMFWHSPGGFFLSVLVRFPLFGFSLCLRGFFHSFVLLSLALGPLQTRHPHRAWRPKCTLWVFRCLLGWLFRDVSLRFLSLAFSLCFRGFLYR